MNFMLSSDPGFPSFVCLNIFFFKKILFLRLIFCDEQHNAPNIRTQRILPAISKPHKFAFFVSTFSFCFPTFSRWSKCLLLCKVELTTRPCHLFSMYFYPIFFFIFEVLVFPTFSHNWFRVVGTCVYKIMIFIPVSEFCFFPSVPE